MYCEGIFGKPANKIGPEGSVVGVAPRVDCAHLNIVNMYFSHVKKNGFTKKKKLDRPIVCSWPLNGSKSSVCRSLVVAASPSQVQFCCKHWQVTSGQWSGSPTSVNGLSSQLENLTKSPLVVTLKSLCSLRELENSLTGKQCSLAVQLLLQRL